VSLFGFPQQRIGGWDTLSSPVRTLADRFPMLNSVMQKVNLRQRKNAIVISLTIAICLILMFLYAT
jgi:Golgi SNAP receptor complex protein 1